MKNWAGLDVHPTDEFVHWADGKPAEKMKKLRVIYERLAISNEAENDLNKLLEYAFEAGFDTAMDNMDQDL